jgi:hypothetical protein
MYGSQHITEFGHVQADSTAAQAGDPLKRADTGPPLFRRKKKLILEDLYFASMRKRLRESGQYHL